MMHCLNCQDLETMLESLLAQLADRDKQIESIQEETQAKSQSPPHSPHGVLDPILEARVATLQGKLDAAVEKSSIGISRIVEIEERLAAANEAHTSVSAQLVSDMRKHDAVVSTLEEGLHAVKASEASLTSELALTRTQLQCAQKESSDRANKAGVRVREALAVQLAKVHDELAASNTVCGELESKKDAAEALLTKVRCVVCEPVCVFLLTLHRI